MESEQRQSVIADIHGDYDKLMYKDRTTEGDCLLDELNARVWDGDLTVQEARECYEAYIAMYLQIGTVTHVEAPQPRFNPHYGGFDCE